MRELWLFFATLSFGMGSLFTQDILKTELTEQFSYTDYIRSLQLNPEGFLNGEMKQNGRENMVRILQEPASDGQVLHQFQLYPLNAILNQCGSNNTASLIQHRQSNNGTILQQGDANLGVQYQDNREESPTIEGANSAFIDQSGSLLHAVQVQNGTADYASVQQFGYENWAEQWQGVIYSVWNKAFAFQEEIGNNTIQLQSGVCNDATVYQKSFGNLAIQNQGSLGLFGLSEYFERNYLQNKATILQDGGGNNVAKQYQINMDLAAIFNEVVTIQNGQSNSSEQHQVGGSNYSLVRQSGSKNNTEIIQHLGFANP